MGSMSSIVLGPVARRGGVTPTYYAHTENWLLCLIMAISKGLAQELLD